MSVLSDFYDFSRNSDVQLVYLDFDGAQTTYDNLDLDLSFDVEMLDSGLTETQKKTILELLSTKYADTGIVFTDQLPGDGLEYSTVFIGKSTDFESYGNFAGLAETIDKDNKIKNDDAFVIADKNSSCDEIVSVIEHELEHIIGGQKHSVEVGNLQDYAAKWFSEENRLDELYNDYQITAPDLGTLSSDFVYNGSTTGSDDIDYICFTAGISGTLTISPYTDSYTLTRSNTEVHYNNTLSNVRATPYQNMTVSVTQGTRYYFAISNYNLYQTSEFYTWQFSFSGGNFNGNFNGSSNSSSSQRPDLSLSRISFSSTTVGSDENVTIQFDVDNRGNASAPSSWVYIYDGSKKIGSVKVDSLAPIGVGTWYQRCTFTIAANKLSVGMHNIRIVADAPKAIKESDESDNIERQNIKVILKRPDLVVKNLSFSPSTIGTNQKGTVIFNVANSGNADVAASWVYIYDGNKKIGSLKVNSISAYGNRRCTFTIPANKLSAGTHNIRIVADAVKSIKESNESNNTANKNLKVFLQRADLTVKNISFSPSTIGTSQKGTVIFNVANSGNAAAAASWVYIYDGNKKIGSLKVNSISAYGNQRCTFTIPANKLSVGTHNIRIVADAAKSIKEFNESNNTANKNLKVIFTQTDLRLGQLTMSPATATTNQDITLKFNLINSGNIATGTSWIYIYDGNKKIGSIKADSLKAYGSVQYSYKISAGVLSAGNHNIKIVADASNAIKEKDEGNNSISKSISIKQATDIDLKPFAPYGWDDCLVLSDTEGTNGDMDSFSSYDSIYVDFAVINDFDADINQSFKSRLSIDGTPIDEFNHNGLGSGYYSYIEDYRLDSLSSGWHSIELQVDCNNAVAETNENNNTTNKWFYIA